MTPPLPPRLLVIDTETTGLDPTVHGLIEIGAVAFMDHRIVEVFSYRIRLDPGFVVDPAAVAKNGYDPATWGGRPEAEALAGFMRFVQHLRVTHGEGEWIWCGMCPQFDQGFLAAAGGRVGVDPLAGFSHRLLDVTSLAWIPFVVGAVEGRGLDALRKAMGTEVPKHHGAMSDCIHTHLALQWMFKRLDWRRP